MGKVGKTSRSVSSGYYISLMWAFLSVSYFCAIVFSLLGLTRRSLPVDTNLPYGIDSIVLPIAGIVTLYFLYLSEIKAKKYWLWLLAGMTVTHIGEFVLSQHGSWVLLPYAIAAILATYVYSGFYKVRVSEIMDVSVARKWNIYALLLGFLVATVHFYLII